MVSVNSFYHFYHLRSHLLTTFLTHLDHIYWHSPNYAHRTDYLFDVCWIFPLTEEAFLWHLFSTTDFCGHSNLCCANAASMQYQVDCDEIKCNASTSNLARTNRRPWHLYLYLYPPRVIYTFPDYWATAWTLNRRPWLSTNHSVRSSLCILQTYCNATDIIEIHQQPLFHHSQFKITLRCGLEPLELLTYSRAYKFDYIWNEIWTLSRIHSYLSNSTKLSTNTETAMLSYKIS